MNLDQFFLFILMPLTAFLYASVGHGGASSYIMLLTWLGFAPQSVRPTALMLNIAVSATAFWWYRKTTTFSHKLVLLLLVFSVPASYLGGTVSPETSLYQKVLSILLLFPVLRLFNAFPVREKAVIGQVWWIVSMMGLSIGFVSGLLGIGGGIILSPLLLMLGWSSFKETAVISSLFILVNSVAGLLGASKYSFAMDSLLAILLPLTIASGMLGAYWGSHHLSTTRLRYLLATVLLMAAIKFLVT
jgi:hypothetical protein